MHVEKITEMALGLSRRISKENIFENGYTLISAKNVLKLVHFLNRKSKSNDKWQNKSSFSKGFEYTTFISINYQFIISLMQITNENIKGKKISEKSYMHSLYKRQH